MDVTQIIKILTINRDLIQKGWCLGHVALDAEGKIVYATSEKAVYFCIYGAFEATGVIVDNTIFELFKSANGIPSGKSLAKWNDEPGRTQAQVVKALQNTIDYVNSQL